MRSLAGHAPLFDGIIECEPRRILEVGSGTGIMPTFLSWLGYDLSSVDNDREVLAQAEKLTDKLHGKCSYAYGDAFDLLAVFPKDSFDAVFSQGFFEHFSDDQIRALIRQQLAVSRTVIFSVPSRYYRVLDFGNERLLSERDWRMILKPFSVRYVTGYHPRLRGIKSLVRDSIRPWRLMPWRQPEHWLIRIDRE